MTEMSEAIVRDRKFKVALKRERDGGYVVWAVELPGCISQGDTKEEALANIKEAIECYLEAREIIFKREARKGVETVEVTV